MSVRISHVMSTALVCALFTFLAPTVHAATITVTTTDDEKNGDGDCSLREALFSANNDIAWDGCVKGTGFDTIIVPVGVYVLTLTGVDDDLGNTGDLDITNSGGVEIIGAGMGLTIIDGNGTDRVMEVKFSAIALLSDLTLRNGYITSAASNANGGGLQVGSGSAVVDLTRVSFENNTAAGKGATGGALSVNGSTVTITECVFAGNSATGTTWTSQGGAVKIGAAASANFVTIRRSLFSGNSATGVTGRGGAIYAQGNLEMTNSTVTNNIVTGSTAAQGGGIYITSISSDKYISASTIAGNSAAFGGGVWAMDGGDDTGPYFTSTIIADNLATSGSPDMLGRIQSRGYLLIVDSSGAILDVVGNGNTSVGNQLGVDPMLGELPANPGPASTLAIDLTSPAVDAGSCLDANGATVDTDQRGVPRPQLSTCDIGAFEYAPGNVGLMNVTAEAPGPNCVDGGQRVDTGVDWDGSGTLDTAEISATNYVCNGADGIDGIDGATALISNAAESAGPNCTAGGQRIDTGLDNGDGGGTGGDGTLASGEIDDTFYVCNGLTTLVVAATETAGVNCASGGQRITVGLDNGDGAGTAGNGSLEVGEVDQTVYVCDGTDGTDGINALVNVAAEAAGANCVNGGQRIETGLDNGDGGGAAGNLTLETGEVDQTRYVCNGIDGTDGTNGTNGTNGYSSLTVVTTLSVGDGNCSEGGSELRIGLDDGSGGGTPGNLTLETGEIDQTLYLCNGANGYTALVNVTTEASGANCTEGGQRVEVGIDNGDGGGTPNNAVLEAGEVDQTAYVCDGIDGAGAFSSLMALTVLPVGDANCAAGGTQVDVGIDNGDGGGTADDGTMQAGEIDQTAYVCNGADGTNGGDGGDGTDGVGALLTSTPIAAGDDVCPGGGMRIETGVDSGAGGGTAGNGTLEPGEVTESLVVCNGVNGSNGGCATGGSGGPGGAIPLLAVAFMLTASRRRRDVRVTLAE